MADHPPPDPERTVEAYRLYVEERLSVRQVAERMGLTRTTAHRWIHAGREKEGLLVTLLNQAEEREWAHDVYRTLEQLAAERLEKAEDEQAAVWWFDRVVKVLKERRELAGLDAPRQLAVRATVDRPERAPDRGVTEAARRAVERNALDEQELRAGRPGVIESGE